MSNKMLHFVSENPSTLVSFPLNKYWKTFSRTQKRAIGVGKISTLALDKKPLVPLSLMELADMAVLIFRQGAFTTCLIIMEGDVVAMGTAKLHRSTDKDNPRLGEHIAVRRAIENLFAYEVRELTIEDVDSLVEKSGPENEDGVFEVRRMFEEVATPIPATQGQAPIQEAFISNNPGEVPVVILPEPGLTPAMGPEDFGGSDYPDGPVS